MKDQINKKAVEEAVVILKEKEFGKWEGEIADAERVILALASSYLNGTLDRPMMTEKYSHLFEIAKVLDDFKYKCYEQFRRPTWTIEGYKKFIMKNAPCSYDINDYKPKPAPEKSDEPRSLYQCKGCSVRCQALIPQVCEFKPDVCLDFDIAKNYEPKWENKPAPEKVCPEQKEDWIKICSCKPVYGTLPKIDEDNLCTLCNLPRIKIRGKGTGNIPPKEGK